MKVTQLVFDVNGTMAQYPYHFRIDVPTSNRTPVSEVVEWAKETGFKCSIFTGAVYVPTEKDAVLFILRWA